MLYLKRAITMLSLARRWESSIYSHSANGGSSEGVQKASARGYHHSGVGCPEDVGRPELRDGPDIRRLSDFHRFGSGGEVSDVWWLRSSVNFLLRAQLPDVRRASVVRGLGVVGRPGWADHPWHVALSYLPSLGCSISEGSDVWDWPVVRCL